MRILFISPRQALPLTSGAKLRDYYLARALGRRNDLVYLHFQDPLAGEFDAAEFSFAQKLVSVPKPRGYTLRKIARGLFGRWPISVVNYLDAAMTEAISSLARDHSFDLIHLDAIQMAGYGPLLAAKFPKVPIVYDWHNIESELMARFSANTNSPLKRMYASMTARRLAKLERWILKNSFGHVVCSAREQAQLLRIEPGARVSVIDNGVDTEAFAEAAGSAKERKRIVFVGSMNYHANVEAAAYFTIELWPAVQARFPQWTLTLVGSNPTPGVRALGEIAGVAVTGTVEDIRPYYEEAVAAIVPIRTAGGTRLKILEAMAAGVPVVSTTIGAEGLDVTPGESILIADGESQWMDAFTSLLEPAAWNRLAAGGRHLTQTQYDWNQLGNRLHDLYESWLH